MEDKAEQAFILYCAFVYLILVAGVLTFFLSKKRPVKAVGVFILLFGCLAAVRFDQALDWLYHAGMFNYLP